MMSTIFKSEKRSKFYEQSGLPFFDAFYEKGNKEKVYYSYALYTCRKESEKRLKMIEEGSALVAQVFDKVLERIKHWEKEEFEKWHFDPKYQDLVKLDWDKFFCMRVGWAFDGNQPKVMEINSQTPSFWFEPEMGNPLLAKQFNRKNAHPFSQKYLKQALNEAIKQGIEKRPTIYGDKPKVGFITCNWYEDLHIMNWLSQFCDYDFEILAINNLDFTKKEKIPFNRETGSGLDVLILWYPLEWLKNLKFQDGSSVWKIFIEAIEAETTSVIHALPAFFIQSKAILAYITEHERDIFVGKLAKAKKFFAKTYLSPEKLGDKYCAKPIFGREGRGSFIKDEDTITRSRYQEDYYVKQPMIYQQLLKLPKLEIENKEIHLIYEAWVYRAYNTLVPGAIGVRGSEHLITDDYSYWVPIGV